MDRKNYLLYTIVTCWDEPPRARHQIANELKLEGNVYFLEKNKVGFPHIEVKEVEPHVFTITPYFFIDNRLRYRTPGINEAYHRWLIKKVKRLGVNFEMVVTFDYTAPAVTRAFPNSVFFCADDNVGFGKFNPAWINRYHTKTEEEVAKGAKICVVTSDYMFTKISAYNKKTYNIPLGAPEIHLKNVTFRNRPGTLPVLGLVGYLDSNLDDRLLDTLLNKFKITFIGPASKETQERLLQYANATLLGPKNGIELYDALQKVDVCIAPYDLKKINKGATPNKLWLYLAMGRPSVITKIPNIDSWVFDKDLVYICDNDVFVENCLKAYENDSEALTHQRIEEARKSSWNSRVKQLINYFNAAMQ